MSVSDSDFAALEAKKAKRIRFDPTVNAGHVLTTLVIVSGVFVGWTELDKRVVALEEGRKAQEQLDRHQDQMLGQQMLQIKESLSEIKRNVERVNDKLEKRP